jgi:hypothetical protein
MIIVFVQLFMLTRSDKSNQRLLIPCLEKLHVIILNMKTNTKIQLNLLKKN